MEQQIFDVTIIMGSDSDLEVVKPAFDFFKKMKVSFEARVASAHRTPQLLRDIVTGSTAEVFLAAAGMSAALPGCIAALTTKPVIGIPVKSKFGLQDSMLSIIQMPPGIPVSGVGIEAAKNAAIIACEILALNNEKLSLRLAEDREVGAQRVIAADEKIRKEYSYVTPDDEEEGST